jgi:hypothetical protein
MSKNLALFTIIALAALMLVPALFAQEFINTTTVNVTTNLTATTTIDSPFADNSRVCIFIKEWVLKSVFIVILLVFLLGVAVMAGAAFPDWRDHGSKMILGSLGAVVLYLIGLPALKFLMGVSGLCGL